MRLVKLLLLALALVPVAASADDFPTLDTVGFVLTCMESNGGISRETLHTCSCRIDHIAASLTFEEYEEAEIWERYQGYPGERGAMFRSSMMGQMEEAMSKLRRAQFEAKQACPLIMASPDSRPDDVREYRGLSR